MDQGRGEGMRGRPRITIDFDMVRDLASIMCTQEEIACILKVSASTLQHNKEFLQVYKEAQETAKSSLRRAQYKAALNGNVVMQIWLGKQYLNQKDVARSEVLSNVNMTIEEKAATMTDEELDLEINRRVKKLYGSRHT